MKIRAETGSDRDAVRALNLAAFDSPVEASLVDALRLQADPCVSLVAEDAGEIIGHILFSPAKLSADQSLFIMALGPMAVIPGRQHEGVGSALIHAGLERCRQLGCQAVFVLGYPQFYPRFGFVPASRFEIDSLYDVPDDVFMAIELEAGVLSGRAGTMHYHPAFDGL